MKNIKERKVLERVGNVIKEMKLLESISQIKGLKKLRGSNIYYRIRIGGFRLGLSIENDKITLIRILNRKDIYKYFPR